MTSKPIKHAATLADVVQSSLWVLMLFFPSYIWPGLGILTSFGTLFLFRDTSRSRFRRPLFIGVLIFHLLVFLWPVFFTESPLLGAAYCIALGVLTTERIVLYVMLPRSTKVHKPANPGRPEEPVRF